MRVRYAFVAAMLLAAMTTLPAASPAAVRSSQSGWSWGSPRPQGNSLNAVDFAGARGYAVGDFGTILRTDDGGNNWSGVRTGTLTTQLTKLRVVDADTFVAGGGCTLLRSTDGGQTIATLRFNPTAQCNAGLSALHFPTKDVGYLFRTDLTVLRTDDGGQRFAARTPVPAGGGGPVNDAWFTTNDSGVVVTGQGQAGHVFRTTDGGGSWTDVASSQALRGVHFVNATTGYAVGETQVLKSVDGGATWTPMPNLAPPPMRSVRCADANHCVVVTVANTVLYTDDGFATLQGATTSTPGATAVWGFAASYASASRAVSVGQNGVTWTSDDGGKSFVGTWRTLVQDYGRIRLSSASAAFAPGLAGSVARTTDAGLSWASVAVPTTNDIVDVSFPTSDLGYALDAGGAVFRTDNGGGTWAILGEARSGVRPIAMSASGDGNTVLLVGPTGLLRSANAGVNFDPVESAAVEKARLTDVDRVTGVVFVYGPKTIAFSTNEGASWKATKRPGRSAIEEVDFVDPSTGYALTADGRVWKTTSRGAKWAELFTTGHHEGYELAFGDKSNGYVATGEWGGSGGGWVLHTSDGGASWRPQLLERNQVGREGLAAAAGSAAYALVPGADLFATATGGDAGDASTLTLTTKTKSLRRKGSVRLTGKLSPSVPGARVEVDVRPDNSARWKRTLVTVRSDGTYSANVGVTRTSYVVAQWAGDQQRNGDGSPALRIKVGR
jgi:photosystem II stability/assembly factor-like uncharacterized protein